MVAVPTMANPDFKIETCLLTAETACYIYCAARDCFVLKAGVKEIMTDLRRLT